MSRVLKCVWTSFVCELRWNGLSLFISRANTSWLCYSYIHISFTLIYIYIHKYVEMRVEEMLRIITRIPPSSGCITPGFWRVLRTINIYIYICKYIHIIYICCIVRFIFQMLHIPQSQPCQWSIAVVLPNPFCCKVEVQAMNHEESLKAARAAKLAEADLPMMCRMAGFV